MRRYQTLQDSDLQLIESICARYEKNLRGDANATIESYLHEGGDQIRPALFAELLAVDLEFRMQDGDAPSLDDCLLMYPKNADAVKRVYSDVMNAVTRTMAGQDQNAARTSPDLAQRYAPTDSSDSSGFTSPVVVSKGSKASRPASPSEEAPTEHLKSPSLTDLQQFDSVVKSRSEKRKYAVEEEIGRGGMGVVFKVRDDNLDRELAMKVIRGQEITRNDTTGPNSNAIARFVREAQITGRLDHPGVVPVHEMASDEKGRMYFTMKYVQGDTLRKVFKAHHEGDKSWALPRVIDVLIRVCETLAFAHSKEVLHRDLKPSNVMVGEFGEAYVMDWGLAKIFGHDEDEGFAGILHRGSGSSVQTMYGYAVGTPNYMPPEQAAGKLELLDPQSDVYSLGAILYELLARKRPYYTESSVSGLQVVREVVGGPPTPILELEPSASPELVAIAEKAMCRDKTQRYSDMSALAEDLRAFVGRRVVKAYKTGPFTKVKKWVERNQGITISGMLALLSIAIGLGVVSLLQFRHQSELRTTNTTINNKNLTITQKNNALAELLQKEREARDQIFGQSLIAHSEEALQNGDAELASYLAMEGAKLYPGIDAINALYDSATQYISRRTIKTTERTNSKVRWSPDGNRILTINGGSVTIVDGKLEKETALLVNREGTLIHDAKWSPDGNSVAIVGKNGTFSIYDSNTGIRRFVTGLGLHYETGNGRWERAPGIALEYCDSGRKIAIATDQPTAAPDGFSKVYVYHAESGEFLQTLSQPGQKETKAVPLTCMGASHDGKYIAAGTTSGKVFVWDAATLKLLSTIKASSGSVQRIATSPDSNHLMTIGISDSENANGSEVACWEMVSGEKRSIRLPQSESACGVFVGNLRAVVGNKDGSLTLCDFRAGKVLFQTEPTGSPADHVYGTEKTNIVVLETQNRHLTAFRIHQQGKQLVIAKSTKLMNVLHNVLTDRISAISAISPDGWRVASGGKNQVMVHDFLRDCIAPTLGSAEVYLDYACNVSGDRIAAPLAGANHGYLFSHPSSSVVAKIDFGGEIMFNKFSFDGTHLVTCTKSHLCKLWNAQTGQLVQSFQLDDTLREFGITDNRFTTRSDSDATIWEVQAGKKVKTIKREEGASLLVTPNGKAILSLFPYESQVEITSTSNEKTTSIPRSYSGQLRGSSHAGRFTWAYGIGNGGLGDVDVRQAKIIDMRTKTIALNVDDVNPTDARISNLVFSRDQSKILVQYLWGNDDSKNIAIISIPQKKLLATLGPGDSSAVGWTQNFGRVVVADNQSGKTRLLDVTSGKTLSEWDVSVQLAEFSSDGGICAIQIRSDGVEPTRVQLRDGTTGDLIAGIPGQNRLNFGNSFLAKSRSLLTYNAGKIRLWPADITGQTKQLNKRELSTAERRLYSFGGSDSVPTAPENRWTELQNTARLLTPVTHERQGKAWRHINAIENAITSDKANSKVALQIAMDMLGTQHEADPKLLMKVGVLHQQYGDLKKAIELFELASMHPRQNSPVSQLASARAQLFPEIATFRSIDHEFNSTDAGRSKRLQEIGKWCHLNSESMAKYFDAKKLIDDKNYRKAADKLRELEPQNSIEPLVLRAECEQLVGESSTAMKLLDKALERNQSSRLAWERWLQVGMTSLNLTPEQLLAKLPPANPTPAPEFRHRDQVKWLLETLVAGNTLRINCGGYQHTGEDGAAWQSDCFYLNGFRNFGNASSGDSVLNGEEIKNCGRKDRELYQTERWFPEDTNAGRAAYRIPLPPGEYVVSLGFAQIFGDGRCFDILLNEKIVEREFKLLNDEWATVKKVKAKIQAQDGFLDIRFNQLAPPGNGNAGPHPKISVIEIRPTNN